MSDSDLRDQLRPAHPAPWSAEAAASSSDLHSPGIGFTSAVQWGLASLLIGCTLLLSSCVTLVFNVLLFRGGAAGIPTSLAFAAGLLGFLALSILGVAGVLFGIRSWQQAYANEASPALGIAGVVTSVVASIAWLIAGIDLVVILRSFAT